MQSVFILFIFSPPPGCYTPHTDTRSREYSLLPHVATPHTQTHTSMQRVTPVSHPIVAGQQCNSRAFHHWKGPQISDEFHTGVIQTMDAIPCR